MIDGILAAYRANPSPYQTPVPIAATREIRYADPRLREVPLYFLHGTLASNTSTLLMTETDYVRFPLAEDRAGLFAILKEQFAQSVFLYVGYSNTDSNWKALLDDIQREFPTGTMPLSYRLTIDHTSMYDTLLTARNIQTIYCSLADFVTALSTQMHEVHMPDEAFKRASRSILPDFAHDFELSAPAVGSLFLLLAVRQPNRSRRAVQRFGLPAR